jgi:hypothetical protein
VRTDLTKACPRCALRVSSELDRCPRCSGGLTTVVRVVGRQSKLSFRRVWSRTAPQRDGLVFGPALLAYVLALGAGIFAAVISVTTSVDGESGALMVGFATLSFLGIFDGTLILAGCVLLLWAIVLWLASLIATIGPSNDPRLDVSLFGTKREETPTRLGQLRERANTWFVLDGTPPVDGRHRRRAPLVSLLILFACELIAELGSRTPYFVGRAPGTS